jgi:hypothetical protein
MKPGRPAVTATLLASISAVILSMFRIASRLPGPSEITLTAKDILTIADDHVKTWGVKKYARRVYFLWVRRHSKVSNGRQGDDQIVYGLVE